MATYLHFAPAIALAAALGSARISFGLMLTGAALAVMPDLDFLSYKFFLDKYSGTYGHRGFTHSIGFALLVGAIVGGLFFRRKEGWRTAGVYLALCVASHPLLDSLIDVGICSAWFWPLDGARHCLQWRPIPMQGISLFGWVRLQQELLWIGVPLLIFANLGMLLRHVAKGWPWHGMVARRFGEGQNPRFHMRTVPQGGMGN